MRGDVMTLMEQAARISAALRQFDAAWRCSWTPRDVLALHVAAGSVSKGGRLLEVGSGFSTGILAAGLPHDDCRMTSVDLSPETCSLARAALKEVERDAEVLHGNVFDADGLPAEIDVLFLDGEHDRVFGLGCAEYLWPRVRHGGRIVLHDMHDRAGSRGEFEAVMGLVWSLGWEYERTAFASPSVDEWTEVKHAAPGVSNCIMTITKP